MMDFDRVVKLANALKVMADVAHSPWSHWASKTAVRGNGGCHCYQVSVVLPVIISALESAGGLERCCTHKGSGSSNDEANMVESDTMTAKQAASYMGVSVSAIYQWTAEGYLPYVDLSGGGKRRSVRLLRSEIDRWLKEHSEDGRLERYPEVNEQFREIRSRYKVGKEIKDDSE